MKIIIDKVYIAHVYFNELYGQYVKTLETYDGDRLSTAALTELIYLNANKSGNAIFDHNGPSHYKMVIKAKDISLAAIESKKLMDGNQLLTVIEIIENRNGFI